MKKLDAKQKHEVSYCIDIATRDEQIRVNVKKVKERIQVSTEVQKVPAVIVGFGPSLHSTWKKILDLKKAGAVIFSTSGAHKFLIDKGIIPTYHVEVDPRKHKIELLGTPHKECTYLPASCVHPLYIKHLQAHKDIKILLWHVFARDGESDTVIPRGEWSITGGCDVGMRAMTIARCLGYRKLHIFGMDGCVSTDGKSHASDHPNAPKKSFPTVVGDTEFYTTPALLESSKQVFHELDQMPDVKAVFYGKGLTQEFAKTYKRKALKASPQLAEMVPITITDDFRKLNQQLHEENPYYGAGGAKHASIVEKMKVGSIESVLDYGCGKGRLQKALSFPIWQYDPAVPEFSAPPRPADLVVCTDVLEHIEPECLSAVLDDLRRVTKQIGYFVIHLGPAQKCYDDGRNTHLIQKEPKWWVQKISKFFTIAKAIESKGELHLVVKSN